MTRRDRLLLFEGIIIGIYGNWLISLIDKISFTKNLIISGIEIPFVQPILILISFACLILLIAIEIFQPRLLTRWSVAIIANIHWVTYWFVLLGEDTAPKTIMFLLIGILLYMMIYFCEAYRAGRIERSKKGI